MMMAETRQINDELFDRIEEQILREPAQFVMWDYFTASFTTTDPNIKRDIPNCGTAACIAGWAIALGQGITPSDASEQLRRSIGSDESRALDDLDTAACRLLGIREEQGQALFCVTAWPEDLQERWISTRSLEDRARIAVERITRFRVEIAEEGKR